MSQSRVYSFATAEGLTKYVDDNDFVNSGTWSMFGTYYSDPLQAVSYGASQYLCVTTNTGRIPSQQPTRWNPTRYWSPLVLLYEYSSGTTAPTDTAVLAQDAYNLAAIGTNTGTAAYLLAESGSNLAQAAFDIAVQGTNLAQLAYNLALAGGTEASQRAYDLAAIGTNTGTAALTLAQSAFEIAVQGTNLAQSAFEIAVQGTDLALTAYTIAVDGTNLAQSAFDIAVLGTNFAQAAYSIAVDGTNLAQAAFDIACIGTNTGTAAYNLAAAGSNVAWAAFALAQTGTNLSITEQGTRSQEDQFLQNQINALSQGTTTFGNPSAEVGLNYVNGSGTNVMRADSAPRLSQAIAPTWSGYHKFTKGLAVPTLAAVQLTSGSTTYLYTDQRGAITVSSNDTTPSFRPFALAAGTSEGHELILVWTGTGSGELLNNAEYAGCRVRLQNDYWHPTTYATMALRFNGTDWLEVSRTPNTGSAVALAAFEIAVDGTNSANLALQTAWDGTSAGNAAALIAAAGTRTASAAFDIAVAGTNRAEQAYALASVGTNTGTAAYNLATAGSNVAWSAYVLASAPAGASVLEIQIFS